MAAPKKIDMVAYLKDRFGNGTRFHSSLASPDIEPTRGRWSYEISADHDIDEAFCPLCFAAYSDYEDTVVVPCWACRKLEQGAMSTRDVRQAEDFDRNYCEVSSERGAWLDRENLLEISNKWIPTWLFRIELAKLKIKDRETSVKDRIEAREVIERAEECISDANVRLSGSIQKDIETRRRYARAMAKLEERRVYAQRNTDRINRDLAIDRFEEAKRINRFVAAARDAFMAIHRDHHEEYRKRAEVRARIDRSIAARNNKPTGPKSPEST